MGRIPDQRHASTAPSSCRQPVIHVVAQDGGVIGRGDQRRHRLRPIAKTLEEILLVALRSGHLTPRLFGHAGPVDGFAGEVECEKFRTPAPPVDSAPGRECDPLIWYKPTPDRRTEINGVSVSEELAAHRGAQAVGAYEQIAGGDRPVTQRDLDSVPVLQEASDVTAKTKPFGPERFRERGLQVRAVDKTDPRAIAFERLAHRHLGEPPPSRIAQRHLGDGDASWLDAQRIESPGTVWPDHQTCADLPQLGRSLEDLDFTARAAQPDAGRQARDSGTGDERLHARALEIIQAVRR